MGDISHTFQVTFLDNIVFMPDKYPVNLEKSAVINNRSVKD